jgi:hypothetical protein
VKTKALVAGPPLQFTDPIESLSFTRRTAGPKTRHDCRPRFGGQDWTKGGTACGSAAILQSVSKLDSRAAQSRNNAKEKGRCDSDHEVEEEKAKINRDIKGNHVCSARDHTKQQPIREGCKTHAERASDDSEQQAFGEQLPYKTHAACA